VDVEHTKESVSIANPANVHNKFYKGIGAVVLMLNKLRHDYRGYKTPRTFPMCDYEKATNYDIDIVNKWLFYLSRYSRDVQIEDKVVLELGPGADLGVGLYLLFKGVSQYNAVDVNNLIEDVPQDFYNYFFRRLENFYLHGKQDIGFLRSQLKLTIGNMGDRLNYICRKDFSLSDLEKKSVDLVFSQAAFEHFDNVEATVRQLGEVCKPGAILIAIIDLKTHSCWIRDKDPLNIYRYGRSFYNRLKFHGSPNRLRPFEYERIFNKHGWMDVRTIPRKVLTDEYLKAVLKSLSKEFHDQQNKMGWLSIILCAKKI